MRRRQSLSRSFVSFVAVGVVATGLQYAVLIAMVECFSWQALFASSVGFCISATVNYLLNYHLTFRSQARHPVAAARFVLVALIGLGINTAVMALLERGTGFHYILSQLLATALTLCWTFGASALWTFREHR